MNRLLLLILFLIAAPICALAQDFHQGGFFDSDVSQTGFFSDAQAGIPIKKNTGAFTTRSKKDSWEVPADRLAAIEAAKAEAGFSEQTTKEQESQEQGIKEQSGSGDTFEVKKEPTD